jgi:hypothetical protein
LRKEDEMAKASKASAAEHVELEGFEGHYAELGGTTVGWETYTADGDMSALFVGLPDDRCQCEHWGYVFEGRLVFHTAAGDEEYTAGDAYAVGPGHTPTIFAGTSLVEFSPTDRLNETMEVVTKNAEAAG